MGGSADLRRGGELDAQLTIEWTGKPGETRTLEKIICYTSDLDMEKQELEPFVRALRRRLHRKASRNLQIFRNDT